MIEESHYVTKVSSKYDKEAARNGPQIHATVVSIKRWSFTRGGLSIMLIREVHAVPGLLLELVSHQMGLSKEGLLYCYC